MKKKIKNNGKMSIDFVAASHKTKVTTECINKAAL